MNRREFSAGVAALGLNAVGAGGAEIAMHVEKLQLSRNGWMPNNDRLPVLLYRGAFRVGHASSPAEAMATQMEETFLRHGWPAQWRNGVYSFHHYHSTAHEVLGFAGGSAHLMLGGEGGHEVAVEAGDVAVLPAGTGHCRITADSGFLVVGAYPVDQHWDICRAAPSTDAIEAMHHVRFPKSDPVAGASGALVEAWRA